MQLNGAQILIKALQEQGVDTIFGYPGGAVLEIYDALKESDIRHVLVRNEQGGAHAASGYARATGKVGVCLATSGPGATNLVTGIATAYMDSVPMVAFTGQVPRSMIGTDAFQEIDITGITSPITKHNYLVQNVEDLARIIAEAFYIARTGRPGPVLIDIPRDVSQALTEYVPVTEVDIRSYKPTVSGHMGMIKRAVNVIKDSKKLVICVGGGVVAGNAAAEVMQLAKMKNATVVATMMGLSGYPAEEERFLGMLGTYGNEGANLAVQDCDCFLALGMRFDDRVISVPGKFAPNAEIIHVDVDPAEIGKNVDIDIPIVGDLKTVLGELIQQLEKQTDLTVCEALYPQIALPMSAGLNVPWTMQLVESLVDKEKTIVTTDVGQHQVWTANSYRFDTPRKFISSGGLGTMGYGIPAAVGAQIACPDNLVIAVTGDGSFQMCMHELGTILEQELPIKILVFNNTVLGMVRQLQYHYSGQRYSGVHFSKTVDFMALAKAYGAAGYQITSKEEAPEILKEAFGNGRFTIVEIAIDPDDLCLPIVLGGHSIDDMVLEPQG
ncbi:MAG: biosynthetic-type acetolactate synthase large subunit [Peptococcaceae bacterium]|nr:biosynthetic-type acetolactate synthase large subunit [Peptococcaceae bacterium]